MKKLLTVFLTASLTATVLSGCGLFTKANGVILYGEEQQIIDSVEREKDKLVEEDQYKIKVVENDEKQIMILTEGTAQALAKKELIRKVIKKGDKEKTETFKSLLKVDKGEGVLFAKQEVKELNVEGMNLNVEYEGNLIIGDGRAYVDMFLIVNDADWASIKGTEKAMAVIEYDKDPSAKGLDYDVEKTQLVRIEE